MIILLALLAMAIFGALFYMISQNSDMVNALKEMNQKLSSKNTPDLLPFVNKSSVNLNPDAQAAKLAKQEEHKRKLSEAAKARWAREREAKAQRIKLTDAPELLKQPAQSVSETSNTIS